MSHVKSPFVDIYEFPADCASAHCREATGKGIGPSCEITVSARHGASSDMENYHQNHDAIKGGNASNRQGTLKGGERMPTALKPEEMRVCELMGVNPHEFIENREKELAAARNREIPSEQEAEKRIAGLMGISPGEIEKRKRQSEKEMEASAPLTDDELKICRLLNVEPLDYHHQKMKDAGLRH